MPDGIASPSWRPPRRQGLDPQLARIGIVALALLAGMGLGFGFWGMAHRPAGPVPVIQAPEGPVRVKPAEAGGMQVADATDDFAPGTAAERLAPPPEQPELALLRARLRQAEKALAKARAEAVPAVVHEAMAISPAPKPAPRAAPLPPMPGTSVQLGAFTTEQAARVAWTDLLAHDPALLGGRTPSVQAADLAGREIWRLRTGGFASEGEAASFCARMRQAGSDCAVAAF